MRYFKQYKDADHSEEITKEEARYLLEGWWHETMLDEIFDNNGGFRLYTAYVDVWTEDDQGRVPIAGFYGVVG